MKKVTDQYFLRNFIKISQELTHAETQMLYLLITEPAITNLSQQEFADRIQTNRRTINIGLKKLKRLHYIFDDNLEKATGDDKELDIKNDIIIKHDEITAKNVIVNSFSDYYKISKRNFIVNEDFFSFIIGDIRIPVKYRHSKTFVKKTIRDRYPEILFYSELKNSDYKEDSHYYIVTWVNSEIKTAKDIKSYRIKIDDLFLNAIKYFSIEEDEVSNIIKIYFPRVRLTSKGISLRKPYMAKKFE